MTVRDLIHMLELTGRPDAQVWVESYDGYTEPVVGVAYGTWPPDITHQKHGVCVRMKIDCTERGINMEDVEGLY